MKFLNGYRTRLMFVCLFATIMLGGGVTNADFTFGTPVPVPNVNSSAWDLYPSVSADGLEMYFHSGRPGGLGGGDLWVSTRTGICDPWGDPCNLGSTVNSSYHDCNPSISADGLSLYFSSNRSGGQGVWDLWVTTRKTKEDAWEQPLNLGWPVNSSADEVWPSVSTDGLQLYFGEYETFRPGGQGLSDIWVATRPTKDDPWGEPENLGPPVNSSSYDDSPFITADGLTLFFSRGDLLVTTRATTQDPWATPVNLGPTLNSSDYDEGVSISPDGRTLYFSSNRSGGYGGYDIYQAPILPKVDFNGDDQVNVTDLSIFAQSWQTSDSACDMAPHPLYPDGVVDRHDLAALARCWLDDYRWIAHWKLDETEGNIAHDSAGDNDGILNGDPIWRPSDGKIQGALELDGVNDYVSTPFVLNPAEGPFSVFMWVKGGVPGQAILSQASGSDWLSTIPPMGWIMTNCGGSLVTQTVITDGQWHRLGLTWDGTNRILYVDEKVVASDTPAGIDAALGGLHIGANNALSAGLFWSGLIDDVRIYDCATEP